MEKEKLLKIESSSELLELYIRELNILSVEHGFQDGAKKSENILEKRFRKTSQRFKTVNSKEEGRLFLQIAGIFRNLRAFAFF